MTSEVESLLETARGEARAGGWDRAIEHFEMALPTLARNGDLERAAATLLSIGHLHFERGALEEARELFEASLAIAEVNGLRGPIASALNALAVVEQFAGRTQRAEALYRQAGELADAVGDHRLVAMIRQNLGTMANIRGDLSAAVEHYRAALEGFQALGADDDAARVLNNLGMAQVDAEEWEAAERSFDRAFEIADRLHHLGTLGNIEINRGDLYLQRGEFAQARQHCDRAFEIFARLESKTGTAEAHRLYGALHRETAQPFLAEMHLLLALELARTSHDRLLEAEAERERALVAMLQGRDREALECLSRAHGIFQDLEAGREVLDIEKRQSRLERTYLQVVTRWSLSIDSLDRNAVGHSARVADLACRLAEALGVEDDDLTSLRLAALLHDLGKVTLPGEVLKKPGPLAPHEWALVRNHPAAGARMIEEKGLPWNVAPIVRSHQESWDGGGHPDGLKGEEIPLCARILRIADSFDTLASPRIYRAALGTAEALRIMEHEAGRSLDPKLFEAFSRMMREEGSGAAERHEG